MKMQIFRLLKRKKKIIPLLFYVYLLFNFEEVWPLHDSDEWVGRHHRHESHLVTAILRLAGTLTNMTVAIFRLAQALAKLVVALINFMVVALGETTLALIRLAVAHVKLAMTFANW